ncbi:MAG: DUF502 domain-containing protein, partial [Bdellovibrionota bacterium]
FISRIFLKGLFTLLPILLTIFLLVWVASSAEWAFGEPLRAFLPFYFPGLGVAVALTVIFIVGLLVNNYLTQKFVEMLETQLERVPIIKSIYSPLRDVTQLFARKDGAATQQRVVLVKFEGAEVMGLVTRDTFGDLPKGMAVDGDKIAVFLPFSYGVGGITVLASKSSVRETDLPAEKAMQLAITGWIKA